MMAELKDDAKKFELLDYCGMEKDSISLEDVKRDTEYVKSHNPFESEYIGITAPALRTLRRGDDTDKAAFVDCLISYFIDGCTQDLDLISQVSDKAATAIDVVITAHEARVKSDIIKRYKQFVGGKVRYAKAIGVFPDSKQKQDDDSF